MKTWLLITLLLSIQSLSLNGSTNTLKPEPSYREDQIHFKIGVDYLFWQVHQDGLLIASDNFYVDPHPDLSRGHAYGANFPFTSGFRAYLAMRLPTPESIDTTAIFSWLSPASRRHACTSNDTGIYTFPLFSVKPTEIMPNKEIFVIDHYSLFQNKYYLLDFEVGRQTQFAPLFILRPFLGLRATWQQQIWYSDEFLFTLTPLTSDYIYDFIQTLSGVGVKSGLNGKIYFSKTLPILKNSALVFKSALSGVYTQTTVTTVLSAVTKDSNLTYYSSKAKLNPIVPVVDLSIGLEYATVLEKPILGLQEIYAEALWETQNWIGINKMLSTNTVFNTPSSMTVQGLTIGLGVVF
ncbi:MAG: Lpg1974 family pore-forming outer membrane protein [Chlamydiia bacterium]